MRLLPWIAVAVLPPLLPAQSAPAAATEPPLPMAVAVRTSGPIRIDGRLDDAAWTSAPVTDRFTQIDPDEGQPASQRTEVRVLYDDEALYVGVRLHDTGPVTARLGRRDGPLGDSDWFGLMIDSYHDHRTAFGFDVNPAGVRRDQIKTIDVDDNSWDAVWEVATTIDGGGWTAEYRVPFSQLRFGRDSAQTWGVQFERIIGRRREYSVSTFIPKRERGGVPRYGHLTGLVGLTPGNRLEVLPYVLSRAEYVDPALNAYRTDREYFTSAGVDLRYRVASNLTLNATINPDFGQVEVDPAVVNLGVYETFFDEKRPFFLEGSEIFEFGANGTSGGRLFYSRRIGRAPTLRSFEPTADNPTNTTILGAGKLSGKAGGWSLGTLAAVTDREVARFRDTASADRRLVTEPRSAYLVGRARRELNEGRTFVGGIATAVRRDLETDLLRSALREGAYTGGLDFRHELPGREWVVEGDVEMSRIEGTPEAILAVQRASNHYFQRPDAEHLDLDPAATSLSGFSANAAVRRQGGEHWRGSLAAAVVTPGYEVNDLGFSYRTDRRDVQGVLSYVQNAPGRVLRRWSATTVGRSEHNGAWEPILTMGHAFVSAQTLGYWNVGAGVTRLFESYDDRLTRGGPLAIRPAELSGMLSVSTDARKPVTGSLGLSAERDDAGGWGVGVSPAATIKASTRWNLRVGPTFRRQRIAEQFVGRVPDSAYTPTYGVRYIFAPLDYTELGLETRLNVTFSPALSLEVYAQPLLSAGDYGAADQLTAARTYDFAAYEGGPETCDGARGLFGCDFNLRSLRGNAVLRWEYRPGSTLYLAWQQSRADADPYGDFSFARDRRALFRARPDNILLLKVSYWLNP